MPKLVDLVVDVRLLLDVGVGGGDVGLRLVVVVVGDEVLDGVVWEEVAELLRELRGERLVRRDDDGRLLDGLDDLGHCVRLAGAGDAEEGLVLQAARDAVGESGDGLWLVAARLEVRDYLEGRKLLCGVESDHNLRRSPPKAMPIGPSGQSRRSALERQLGEISKTRAAMHRFSERSVLASRAGETSLSAAGSRQRLASRVSLGRARCMLLAR